MNILTLQVAPLISYRLQYEDLMLAMQSCGSHKLFFFNWNETVKKAFWSIDIPNLDKSVDDLKYSAWWDLLLDLEHKNLQCLEINR